MRMMHDAPSMRMGLATAILTLTECETAASKRQEEGRKDNEYRVGIGETSLEVSMPPFPQRV